MVNVICYCCVCQFSDVFAYCLPVLSVDLPKVYLRCYLLVDVIRKLVILVPNISVLAVFFTFSSIIVNITNQMTLDFICFVVLQTPI